MAEWSFGSSQRKKAEKNIAYPGPGSYNPNLRHQEKKPSWSMGKPPNYRLSKGAYQFSPAPTSYNVTSMPMKTKYLDGSGSTIRRSSKSPEKVDRSFEYAMMNRRSGYGQLDSPLRFSETLNTFRFKESGPYFGTSDRKPLDIREKLEFPGPGTYKIKDQLTHPK